MKLLKSLISENTRNIGRFVYVKINEGIETILQKDSENEKKSAKERLNDGKKVAMDALPNWAHEMSGEILAGKSRLSAKWHNKESRSGKFWEALKGNESVKQVEELVKSRVFEVIKKGIDDDKSLSPRLKGLMNDIDKNQSVTENTIGDLDQALGTVGKLSDALKSQLDRIQKYQKADNQRKHFWQRLKRKQSDLEIFTQRRAVIENALSKLNANLAERKKETELDINKSSTTAREEFDDLSPDDQKKFREQMQAEINDNKNYHKEFAINKRLDNEFILGIMSNQPLHRRLEIYKLAKLDETKQNRDLLLSSASFQGESAKFHQANEAFTKDRKSLGKLDDLKKNFSKGIEKSEIKPHNDLKGLTKELETEFRGIHTNIKDEIWKDYPANYDPTDLQKFTAFLVALGNGETGSAKKIKKSLRIKLLGYLEHINTEENGEELEKNSIEFVNAEKVAKDELEFSQTTLKKINNYKDLSEINDKVLKDLNDDSFRITSKVDELKDIAKDLTNSEEKSTLNKYIATLEAAAKALIEIRGIWIKEISDFEDEKRDHKKKKKKLESKRDAAQNLANSFDQHELITRKGFESLKESESWKEQTAIYENKKAKLKNLGSNPSLKSAKFTKFNTKLTHELNDIDRDLKKIKKADSKEKSSEIKNNIKDFLKRQSNNDVHEKSKAEFQKLQEGMLTTLAEKGLGSQVKLRGENYKSGNPPNIAQLAENGDKKPGNVKATVWAKSENLVILRSKAHIIVVQKSTETGNVEIIGFKVPSSMTSKDAVIDEFRKKQAEDKYDYISSPTSIIPLI